MSCFRVWTATSSNQFVVPTVGMKAKANRYRMVSASAAICDQTLDTFLVCDHRRLKHWRGFVYRDVYRKPVLGDQWLLLHRQIVMNYNSDYTG